MKEETSVPKNKPPQAFSLVRTTRKFFVSAFVVFTFVAYALHERFVNPEGRLSAAPPTPSALTTQQVPSSPVIPASQLLPVTAQILPTPTAKVLGLYKDGAYAGPEVDAYYGLVQVQAIIQNGEIADVRFLEYPSDRRTSVRINSVAMPYLKTEAIQAQNANVDIVSGATLTSEAFIMSLQSALDTAKN